MNGCRSVVRCARSTPCLDVRPRCAPTRRGSRCCRWIESGRDHEARCTPWLHIAPASLARRRITCPSLENGSYDAGRVVEVRAGPRRVNGRRKQPKPIALRPGFGSSNSHRRCRALRSSTDARKMMAVASAFLSHDWDAACVVHHQGDATSIPCADFVVLNACYMSLSLDGSCHLLSFATDLQDILGAGNKSGEAAHQTCRPDGRRGPS